jgi:hypothetical protein
MTEQISQTNISTKSYREEFKYVAFVHKEKFGECWQTLSQKNVSGSILCCHDRGIWAKYADIWLLRRHVVDMLATFSAKSSGPACTAM